MNIKNVYIGNQPDIINVGDEDSPKWLRVPTEEPEIDLDVELRDDHKQIQNLDGSGTL